MKDAALSQIGGLEDTTGLHCFGGSLDARARSDGNEDCPSQAAGGQTCSQLQHRLTREGDLDKTGCFLTGISASLGIRQCQQSMWLAARSSSLTCRVLSSTDWGTV